MIFDCHIHMTEEQTTHTAFRQRLDAAGTQGGIVFSPFAPSFFGKKPEAGDGEKRLKALFELTQGDPDLYPFYFIDPLEPDALEQVDRAVEAGVLGFKVICCNHYPQDDRAMPVYARIAAKGKPILFHSGILYNEEPSCNFNRPGNFEYLFAVDKLRFALAHASWPWCDELIAMFGKWNHMILGSKNGDEASMFVDITPGTPGIYREDVLRKLLTVGYSALPGRILFGSDSRTGNYGDRVGRMVSSDQAIYDRLGISQEIRDGIFGGNLKKFVFGPEG